MIAWRCTIHPSVFYFMSVHCEMLLDKDVQSMQYIFSSAGSINTSISSSINTHAIEKTIFFCLKYFILRGVAIMIHSLPMKSKKQQHVDSWCNIHTSASPKQTGKAQSSLCLASTRLSLCCYALTCEANRVATLCFVLFLLCRVECQRWHCDQLRKSGDSQPGTTPPPTPSIGTINIVLSIM